MDSSSSLFDMENTKILSKNVIFLSDLVEKVLDKEMGDAVFIPPPIFFRLWTSVHLLVHYLTSM